MKQDIDFLKSESKAQVNLPGKQIIQALVGMFALLTLIFF